jgi:transposase-like protein
MKKRTSNSSVRQAKTARRKYDEEFKRQALMMIRHGQSVRSVAQALGISESLLHHCAVQRGPINQMPSWKSNNFGNDSSKLRWNATS